MITATDTGLCLWPDSHKDPYKLVAVSIHGHEIVVASGDNANEVRSMHGLVSRNPIVDRIELRDFDGVIDTIWKKEWV